jgi:hypothetical protein
MHGYKIEKSEDHYSIPSPVTFKRQIDSTAFFDKINPGKEKNSPYNIEIDEGKPRIEK